MSLVTWLTLGKPGIGTLYTEFTLASAIYVTLYSTTELLKRLRSLRHPLMRFVTLIVLSLLMVIIVSVAYLTLNLLPPTPPHLIGLVLTVTILTGYHVTRRKAEAR
jgi:XapX domain-containing protein